MVNIVSFIGESSIEFDLNTLPSLKAMFVFTRLVFSG